MKIAQRLKGHIISDGKLVPELEVTTFKSLGKGDVYSVIEVKEKRVNLSPFYRVTTEPDRRGRFEYEETVLEI